MIKWDVLRGGDYIGYDEDGNKYKKIKGRLFETICYLAPEFNYYGKARDEQTALVRALNEKAKWELLLNAQK